MEDENRYTQDLELNLFLSLLTSRVIFILLSNTDDNFVVCMTDGIAFIWRKGVYIKTSYFIWTRDTQTLKAEH